MMNDFFTSEENTLILISLLKQNGISDIIASPGATNVSFIASVQRDSFFIIHSVVDERTAAFVACGMAIAKRRPVVLSCTGATASRNYFPGLVEAFAQKAPVLVVTSSQPSANVFHDSPQLTDRSSTMRNMAVDTLEVRVVGGDYTFESAVTDVNQAILNLDRGPVHINLITDYTFDFSVREIPSVRKITKIGVNDVFPKIPGGKIGIFIGKHGPFSNQETKDIDEFCKRHNAVVLTDHTSNFHGDFSVLANLISDQRINTNVLMDFDLIIYFGEISGAYIYFTAKEVWRIGTDNKLHDKFHKETYLFNMTSMDFFSRVKSSQESARNGLLLIEGVRATERKLRAAINDDIPFSNIWVASKLSKRLPSNSVLHLGILNSFRSWNYFEIPPSVFCYANTGGFGIDGCASSLIGSACQTQSLSMCVLGDLAFFYDLSALSIKRIPRNVRLLVINNAMGQEFHNYNHRAFAVLGEEVKKYVGAAGHNGNQSKTLIMHLASSFGLNYLYADNKESFEKQIDLFLNDSSEKPIIFEIQTNDLDETKALKMIQELNGVPSGFVQRLKKIVKKLLGRK